MVWYVLKHRAT